MALPSDAVPAPSQPSPRASVKRSERTPWWSSESVVVALKMALESRVLHLLSDTDFPRFQTTTWLCSWGSSARLVKWVKEAAMTPVMSSSTIPFLPEREWNSSFSA